MSQIHFSLTSSNILIKCSCISKHIGHIGPRYIVFRPDNGWLKAEATSNACEKFITSYKTIFILKFDI